MDAADKSAEAARIAGVKKSAHGVRKIAATIAAENGATAHQPMAIFGWLNIRQAEHYTREAQRAQTGRASDGDSGRNQNFYSRTW
jgi:hypothetical protein